MSLNPLILILKYLSIAELILFSSSDMSRNEEFFSSVETEWQIESGSFGEQWTKVDVKDMEPKLLSDLPELSHESSILVDGQIICLNALLPARFIGAHWILKYSTRRHGTSLKTLYRQVYESDSPNLCVIKVRLNEYKNQVLMHDCLDMLWINNRWFSISSSSDIRSFFWVW